MSIVRTKDHAKILNHMPCNEGSGTSVATEGGATITNAVVTWGTNNAVSLGNLGTNHAVTNGWQSMATGSDWALLLLINMNDAVIATGVIGNSAGHRFAFAKGTAGMTVVGESGTSVLANTGIVGEEIRRVLLTSDNDGLLNFYDVATATDITDPPKASVTNTSGALTSLGAFISSSVISGANLIYGMEMVEFPDGLPADTLTKANALFTLWEAGNKAHYELLEDE